MRKIFKSIVRVIQNTFLAILLSFIIALVCYVFGNTLVIISELAFELFPYNLIILPLVGVLTIFLKNLQTDKLDSSMRKVFQATKMNKHLSLLIVPFQIITTWLAHLAGASVGREGVAVQIGATIANNFSHFFQMDKKLLTSSGKAAGFSSLFGTPLGGLFFVYELNKKKITDIRFWYFTIIMIYCSSMFSTLLGLNHFHYEVSDYITLNTAIIGKLIFASIIFIAVGNGFVYLLNFQKKKYKSIFKNEYKRVIILTILYIVLMILVHGRYMSLGTNLIENAFEHSQVISNVDFIFKLLFTTFIISIGYQGGEVTPLFAIGATLGIVLAHVLGLPTELMAALGYCLVFASATNAYLASFFIALEVFGLGMFPYITICIAIAYLFRNKNGIYNNGVY